MKPRRWTFATLRAAYESHAASAASSLEVHRRFPVVAGSLNRAQAHARAWWRLSAVFMDAVLHPEAHPEIGS